MDLSALVQPAETKILLVVMDGLGGYADADHPETELPRLLEERERDFGVEECAG